MLNVIEIKDFNAPELDIYARYTEARLLNKDHPEEGMFIAESPKVIGRALDAGYEPLSVLVEKKQMEENEETSQIMNRFDDTKVSIFTADFEVLTKLTGFKLTRGMLCAMRRKPLRKFQDLCDGINRIAILENVQNPTNVGAIFRSAAALNMEAVLLSPGCSDPLYRRASRVSMGTVFQIPWTFIRDSNEMRCKREVIWPKQAIAELKKLGYKTAALALTDDSVSIDDPDGFAEADSALHRIIYSASGNRALRLLMQTVSMWTAVSRSFSNTFREVRALSHADHQNIYLALCEHDVEKSKASMRQHLLHINSINDIGNTIMKAELSKLCSMDGESASAED